VGSNDYSSDWSIDWVFDCCKVEDCEKWSSSEKIIVCVRKRPRTPREVKHNEADVVKVSSRQTVVVEEHKVAVDLTKYIQQVTSGSELR